MLTKADKMRIRLEIVDERGFRCEAPDCDNAAEHLHHGCLPDRKRQKEVLFRKENLIMLCAKCNVGRRYDNDAGRSYWWSIQVERYGLNEMTEWLDEVNEHNKIKATF